MAADAVFKIKEAEDEGKEIIKKANEKAKHIMLDAQTEGIQRKGSIIAEANHTREQMLQQATAKANADCEALIAKGNEENHRILNPDASKLESAINLVIGRIVSVDGNC